MHPSRTSTTAIETPWRFQPFPMLRNRHIQTILAARLHVGLEPPAVTERVALADGDSLALEVSTPEGWGPEAPTVVLVHGLCGCHRSPYMMRLARKLWRRGMRAVRMNLRGCGSGAGLARQPYHSGRSEDVRAVLQALHHTTSHSPITLIGFSLGGNLVLKLAGELQEGLSRYVSQVIAVCAAVDLTACARLLAQPENRLYERHFLRLLKTAVLELHGHFGEPPPVELAAVTSLYAFDEVYTAPQCGFRNADDYYARCSAAPLLPGIAVPCRMLFAADDPLIDHAAVAWDRLPSHIDLVQTPYGGHMGFLGRPWQPGGYHWMDTLLLDWIESGSGIDPASRHSL